MSAIKLGGGIFGGSANLTGYIESHGTIASATIGSSIAGGSSSRGGELVATSDIGPVKIAGDIRGGGGVFSGGLESTNGNIASETIGGSVFGAALMKFGVPAFHAT